MLVSLPSRTVAYLVYLLPLAGQMRARDICTALTFIPFLLRCALQATQPQGYNWHLHGHRTTACKCTHGNHFFSRHPDIQIRSPYMLMQSGRFTCCVNLNSRS